MSFFAGSAQSLQQAAPGIRRKVLARGGSLMVVQVAFGAGVSSAPHDHPHEQVSYMVSGRFEWQLGDEKRVLGPGDSVYIPSGVTHGVRALEAAVLVDVFTPQREDFLAGG